ncbi:MAG: HAD hydrolase-like protein [Opitutaceae bacterium]|nr:HAD hydrolase-like protein [Opitutaceae bacterium]
MIIVFDVDGTLVDGNQQDGNCFARAIREVTRIPFQDSDWTKFSEITAKAVVHQIHPHLSPEELETIEEKVAENFHQCLIKTHERNDQSFIPIQGAIELLQTLLDHEDFSVAIAAGDWFKTIHFKLSAAGFSVSDIPMATSSDRYSRAEIIRLAVERADRTIDEAIYVGDGTCDLRATQSLGIPFIGVGHNIHRLEAAGATHLIPHFGGSNFFDILNQIRLKE